MDSFCDRYKMSNLVNFSLYFVFFISFRFVHLAVLLPQSVHYCPSSSSRPLSFRMSFQGAAHLIIPIAMRKKLVIANTA
jgi:hypothetical protein